MELQHTLSGMLRRFLTQAGSDPQSDVAWERRDAKIVGSRGQVVFEQSGIEVPKFWSTQASTVVASKYFRGQQGTMAREFSVRQLFDRVVNTLVRWGTAGNYFTHPDDASIFRDELMHLLLHQMASFNSPVWFNVGVHPAPQCSACFINSVQDSMESILSLAQVEGRLFKNGSGTGTNLSVLRGKREPLSGGGTASGPVSFMRGFDAFAGVIKSGGTTRRAAKMVILDIDHPDIVDFIWCKAREERKAWALMAAGYDGAVDGEAYDSVFFQNSNNSVRLPDAFMDAVLAGGAWETRNRVDGRVAGRYSAPDLFAQICESAHLCGDPGLQFHSTINRWHTCPLSGPIEASNPCSEYMFLNDTACNLASLNLLAFRDQEGALSPEPFAHAVRLLLLAQEIIVDNAGYPTPAIAENSRACRPLGLGYANLGAYLMARGMPYDSDSGRLEAAMMTALMGGVAYGKSADMAAQKGAFSGFDINAAAMRAVIGRHRDALAELPAHPLKSVAQSAWDEALQMGALHGYRNAQVTVLAPTGTIAFMMDCATTGVEPDVALVKHKALVGGGLLKMVNSTIPEALERLGYGSDERHRLLDFLAAHDTLEGAPDLHPGHAAVFDCAFSAAAGTRRIAPLAHVRMVAAVQPFLSGAVSKTVNLPHDASVADISEVYQAAWRLGLKAVAVYRDGCKRAQPLSTSAPTVTVAPVSVDAPLCSLCEAVMLRMGPCFRCMNCGASSACS